MTVGAAVPTPWHGVPPVYSSGWVPISARCVTGTGPCGCLEAGFAHRTVSPSSQGEPSSTHCSPAWCWAGYLARGLNPPAWRRGKNNNLQAKKLGSCLGAYLSRGRKRLCSLSAQRLFITLTRGCRKCSICWVQPATHTAYKLRAFTCRVPEIKHTHTHKRERSFVSAPALCLSPPVPAPQPRPGAGSCSGIPHYL